MLHAISWMRFGIAVLSAGLLYYLVILFKYYRLEIGRLFQAKQSTEPSPPGHAFGAVQINEAEMNLVDENELNFADAEPDEVAIKAELLGGIADFMHELNALLRIATTKDEFLLLLTMLSGKYPDATAIRYAEPIALHILEEGAGLPFPLTKDEIENALIPGNDEN